MSTNQKNNIPIDVNHAIKVLGDDHVLCIIVSLRGKIMRFSELQRSLGINPTTLAGRLNRLEQEGILDRKEETLDKLSVVYELTKKGEGILPIISEFEKYAKKFPRKKV